MTTMKLNDQDLAENPQSRLPVCLVLDTSGSMVGAPIDELNEGVKHFVKELLDDELVCDVADVAIVTYGESVKKQMDFSNVSSDTIVDCVANGATPMGEAIEYSLDLLEKRKKEYKNHGTEYYQPWMCIMSDGIPTDPERYEAAVVRSNEMVNGGKLTIFPVAIGENADINVLNRISPKLPALRLEGLKFKEFFEWLSRSAKKVSESMPGEEVSLPQPTWVKVLI